MGKSSISWQINLMKDEQANESRLILRILWGALFAGQALYLMVLIVVPARTHPVTGELADKLVLVLGASAGLAALAAWFLTPYFARANPKTASIVMPIERQVFAAFLMRLCLLEMICILGFVASFLTAEFSVFLPFVAISCLGFLLSFPNDKFLQYFSGRRNPQLG